MRDPQLPAMERRLLEQVLLRADGGLGRGHHLFANRIDRRIGDLREKLLEIIEQRLRPVREHRQRRVGAHRAHRLLRVHRHRRHDDPEILEGVAERLLELEQVVLRVAVDRRRLRGLGQRVEIDHLLVEPLAIRLARRHRLLDFLVLHDAPEPGVDEEHAARLQAALERDVLRRNRQHAGLRRHHHQPVLGDRVARRPQPVAIEHRADADAVGERDRGGTVPRLHHAGVELVERALAVAHLRVVLPRLGDHHHHRMRQ